MSTSPTSPVTPVAVSTVAQTWLQAHERIVLVLLVLLAGSWGLSRYLDYAANKADTRATVAEQVLNAQKSQDAALALQSAQVLSQYQAMVSELTAQNSALAAAAAQRQAIVVKNQTQDTSLSLPVLAKRLQTLGNAPDGTVTATGDNVNITHQGAVAVVQTLETVPALQADLKDFQDAAKSCQSVVSAADTVHQADAKQIAALQLTAVDQDKACKTQVAAVTAEANKSKRKWFLRGVLVGFLGGLWSGHSGL